MAAADSSTPGRLSLHLATAAAFADSSIHILYGPRRGDASTILIRIPRGTLQLWATHVHAELEGVSAPRPGEIIQLFERVLSPKNR